MIRPIAALCLILAAAPGFAESDKETDCRYQSEVAAAVQKARLDGVREQELIQAIAATNPQWPERYNNAIPILGGEIYKLKKRDLRKVDLGAQWRQMCLSQ
ncbi:hypothetical protein LCL97_02235 [Seohaeicola saemankumensis]|nr:hypothetical protein [Seohaeicola saemankumensis]MCA0869634.1 hypothetical protein [Seohaeicola saemankumensis]